MKITNKQIKKTGKQWLGNTNLNYIRNGTTQFTISGQVETTTTHTNKKITKENVLEHLNYLLDNGGENDKYEEEIINEIIQNVKNN